MASSSVQIIPYYAHPHIHSVITDDSWYDETVAVARDPVDLPYSTLSVIGADTGIDNTFIRVSDLETKTAIFGKGNFNKYGQASLQADTLFNGYTNVWMCRVLPDNATYASMVVVAYYRSGKILDDLGQETGKVRMEVKFGTAYASKPYLSEGAKSESDIEAFAESLRTDKADPLTGYMCVPLFYVKSLGRGQYGNRYSLKLSRDVEAERDYNLKMYRYTLLTNEITTKISNIFTGSMVQTSRYEMSTLIDDVLDQFTLGSCPIKIKTMESGIETLFDFYKKIITVNDAYIMTSGTVDDKTELRYAQTITEDTFDPIFGLRLNTRSSDIIPYYRNYTVKQNGPWKAPDLTIPNTGGAQKPLNISDWNTATIGATVLVLADPIHDGYRWKYTVLSIDSETGNIVYNEGREEEIDADQYDGVNINLDIGNLLNGGHDGYFQEIVVGGESRRPTEAEMKLLLSREYVKALRGEKDKKILSPSRINLDFIFDANYNMTSDETLSMDSHSIPLYNHSTILTDKDSQQLSILGTNSIMMDFNDINVKGALYDLNEFRNRNGMTINPSEGAGCSLYLDCNLTGLKSMGSNAELNNVISMMEGFEGRSTSIDLGYFEIFDPITYKKIKVTTSYFIAKNLVPHIMKYGMNKPFVYNYAQMRAIQKNSSTWAVSGDIIKDSFRPDIDLIDWDVKERLFNSRINYYLTSEEGRVVQRAVQNTRQLDASALLEENNVRVLNALKKNLEKACRGYLYEWNEPEVRRGYTEAQMEIYRPWIGTMVQNLNIVFTANEWEQERMIMRCYVEVAFRDIIKRIILEINIQKPVYDNGGE